jgi:hypothetical protein
MTKSRREYEEVECEIEGEGLTLFAVFNGQRIAKYTPNTPAWVVLVPGFTIDERKRGDVGPIARRRRRGR